MDLEGIRLLMRVIELGSMQSAAHHFGIPRSSLRRKLEQLEAGIGRELFVRSSAGVSLTAAGAIVLEQGRGLLEQYERMVSSVKSNLRESASVVRLVIPVGMPDVARVALLRALLAASAGVRLHEMERADPLDHLHEPFDLMFHFGAAPERGKWFSRLISRTRLMPLASKAYLSKRGRPRSLAELENHTLLSWRTGGSNPDQWPLLAGGTLPVSPAFTSYNGQTLHLAAERGVGILLGTSDPPPGGYTPELVPVLADEVGDELCMRCLSPVPGDVDPGTRAVLGGIHAFLSQIAVTP